MKKLILSTATVLFISLTAFGQDKANCTSKCINKCNQKVKSKELTCNDNIYSMNAFTSEKKCSDEKKLAKNNVNRKAEINSAKSSNEKLITYNKK